MYIKRLLIDELRNLKQVSLDDFGTLNFFVGDNGAGKTSLLEAISIVSQGRSFRNNKVQTIISQQEPALRVFLECKDDHDNSYKLGIERDRKNQYAIRINGANAQTLAELTAILPVVVLDATAFDLLDGAPSIRRKFLDWGVFHVEHGFFEEWRSYNRALKQRNALLRNQDRNYQAYIHWDQSLVQHAIAIENYRLNYLEKFQKHLGHTLNALGAELEHTIFYKNGWNIERLDIDTIDEDKPVASADVLMDKLKEQFGRDLKYQTTHIGPHKADIQLRLQNNDVKDIYSRGQKKILVAAMKLAQAKTVKMSQSHKSPVLLLDDLPSELDDQHLALFLNYVCQEGYQCFITAVDDRIYKNKDRVKARMFHVERGKITPITNVSRGTISDEIIPTNH
jgi:DNA replication and repair protein RecF